MTPKLPPIIQGWNWNTGQRIRRQLRKPRTLLIRNQLNANLKFS